MKLAKSDALKLILSYFSDFKLICNLEKVQNFAKIAYTLCRFMGRNALTLCYSLQKQDIHNINWRKQDIQFNPKSALHCGTD